MDKTVNMYEWLKDAPQEKKEEFLIYWSNRAVLWNQGLLSLTTEEKDELAMAMQAAARVGIDKKTFYSYSEWKKVG